MLFSEMMEEIVIRQPTRPIMIETGSKMKHPSGCQTFQHDLPIVLEVVTLDRSTDGAPGQYHLPIIR
jgi:hypothetical protein